MLTGPTLLAFAASLLLVPLVRRIVLQLNIVDIPNERSSHHQIIPRGGGLAIAVATSASVLLVDTSSRAVTLVLASCALGVVGLLDDRSDLGLTPRLVAQIVVATAASVSVVSSTDHGFTTAVMMIVTVGAIVGVVGYINAFNFMDGINGISAAQGIVAGVAFAVIGLIEGLDTVAVGGAVVAAAFVGFLPYNAPRALIFLGDVGSYFAGCWLALLAVLAAVGGTPVEVAVAPLVYYVADTAITLVARTRAGHRVGTPHRSHAYQRLARRLSSHTSVAAIVGVLIAINAAVMIALIDGSTAVRLAAFAAMVALAATFVDRIRRDIGVAA